MKSFLNIKIFYRFEIKKRLIDYDSIRNRINYFSFSK